MALPHHTLDIDARGVATLTIANGTPLNILDSATIAAMTATLRRLARSGDAVRDLCEAMRDFPAPTIARMAGWCMRAGCC